MKTLIIGADGQLGSQLIKILPDAIGTARKNGSRHFLDLNHGQTIEDFILKMQPEVIVNAAANTNVDKCEEDRVDAFRINGTSIKHMVRAARVVGSYFIHISTDYVFDGHTGMYNEQDIPNPVDFYGLSKMVGEANALSYDDSIVIRTSGVYGVKMNFPLFVVRTLKEGGTVKCIDSYYSPIHAKFLAEAVKEISERRIYGILNVAGPRISRYDFANKIMEELDIKTGKIVSAESGGVLKAKRPYDSSLDSSRAKKLLQTDFDNLKASIKLLGTEVI